MLHKISRRRLLTGTGSLLGAALGSGFSTRGFAASRAKVIVIGAGVSGLAAARLLKSAGCEVEILEARSRIGGRIFTDHSLGAPVEHGAGWIHGLRGNPVMTLAQQAGAKTFVTDDENKMEVYRPGGKAVPDREMDAAEARYTALLARIDDEVDEHSPLSLAAAIAARDNAFLKDPLLGWVMTEDVESDAGAAVDDISAYWFDEDSNFAGPDAVLPGGYDAVPAFLARGLNIALNKPVRRIMRTARGVSVETDNEQFQADHAICTIPLGVLKAGSVTFDPPLPQSHVNAIARTGFGTVTKASVEFTENLWGRSGHFFGLASALRGHWAVMLNVKAYSGRNILTGICTGPYAAQADAMDSEARKADMLDALSQLFGKTMPAAKGFVSSAWSRDEFARGAYSVAAPGSRPGDFDAFQSDVDGRLFFAGEHTGFAYHSTVHGAFMSGERAARAIISKLGG